MKTLVGGWNVCQAPDVNAIAWRREMMERLRGERCYAGADLALRWDMNALVLFFPDVKPRPIVLPFYWIPEAHAITRERRDRVPYRLWADRGFLTFTPGEETDVAWIAADIAGAEGREEESLWDRFEMERIDYDPWKSVEFVKLLEAEGVPCVKCQQVMGTLAAPSDKLEDMVRGGGFDHGANPVLTWNARNAVAKRDPKGNVMPDKSKAKRKRIDGIDATVNALRGWLVDEAEGFDVSGYAADLEEMRGNA